MTTYLLDVNVLIALSDPMHVYHEAAHRWFATRGQSDWATCPLTENGLVRIASHPSYPNRPGDASVVLALLRQLCTRSGHAFWADQVSLRTMLRPGAVITHNQVTDIYLLGLAVTQGGKLATFDQHIPVAAIAGGAQAIEIINV
jgi:toxin-antitoxin system PIN domain toxin